MDEPKSRMFCFSIDPGILELLRVIQEESGCPIGETIKRAIVEYIERYERKLKP